MQFCFFFFGSTCVFFDTLLVGFGPPILAHAYFLGDFFLTSQRVSQNQRPQVDDTGNKTETWWIFEPLLKTLVYWMITFRYPS